MFALASWGEGGAAPFIVYDVILRARPQTCGARRISCRPHLQGRRGAIKMKSAVNYRIILTNCFVRTF